MRRIVAIAAILPGAFIAGFIFMLIEFEYRFHFLGPGLIVAGAIRSSLWTLVLPLCIVAARRVVRKRRSILTAATLTSICFAAAMLAEVTYITYVAGHNGLRMPRDRTTRPPAEIMAFVLTSVHAPFVLLLCSTMLVALVGARDEEREGELKVNRLEARLSEARLNLLRSQLHPHFLFNSLNSVSALIRHDAVRAREMLGRLSQFFIIASTTEGQHVVSLAEELRTVREYVGIEQIRFGSRLTVDISADARALNAGVPTLLLQPLVENSIKHGVARTPGPGWVRVCAVADVASLQVSIEDNGHWLPDSERGVGLANTHARLQQLYGESYAFWIEPIPRGGSRVRLQIPLHAAARHEEIA
jgi:two-component system, LytTR family, sensor kinase